MCRRLDASTQSHDSAAAAWHNCRQPKAAPQKDPDARLPASHEGEVMLQPTGTRVRFIDSVVRGPSRNGGSGAPEYVKRSWRRCLDEYGLGPDSSPDPPVGLRQDPLAPQETNPGLRSFSHLGNAELHPP